MVKEKYLRAKYIVYKDDDYHYSWVYPNVTNKIVDFLTSKERKERKFIVANAKQLKKWMDTRKVEKDSYGTVVVFAQDMIPDTLAPDFSPSIILRSYLDAGGRIVWIGNIPFWLQGKSKKDTPQGKNPWIEWQFFGIFSILGLNAEFNYSPAEKARITDEGKKWGLKEANRWYGTRPIREGKETVKVLAESSARKPKVPELLSPEREKLTLKDVISTLSAYLSLIVLLVSIIMGLTSGLYSFYYVTQPDISYLIAAVISGIITVFAVVLAAPKIYRRIKPKRYANAWIKNFNPSFPDSGFIRIWDTHLYDISAEMLEDLFQVSTHGLC